MDKPISVIIEEAKNEIVEVINKQHLSPTILDYIVREIYEEVKKAHIAEYENDLKAIKEAGKE